MNTFHEERRQGIGGSDIGAILGLSKYRTPLQVWEEKTGRAQPHESNLSMRFGTMAERFVAEEYTSNTGRRVEGYTRMLRHHTVPLIGHPDRLVIPEGQKIAALRKTGEIRTDRLLECKTSTPFALTHGEWGESGTDWVPPAYLMQCAAYMSLTGCDVADLACLFGNQELRVYTIARDMELEDYLLSEVDKWWNRHVISDVPPDPVNRDDCLRLWPAHKVGKSVIVDMQVANDIRALAATKAKIKALNELSEDFEARVMAAFGDAEEITHMGAKLATWKQNKSRRIIDWEKLAIQLNYDLGEHGYDNLESYAEDSGNVTIKPGARVLRINKQEN